MKKHLKNTLTILSLLLTITLFSCGEEEDPISTSNAAVDGDWEMTALVYSGTSTTSAGGFTVSSDYTGVGYNFSYILSMDASNNTYTTSGGYTIELSTTTNGFTQVQDFPYSGLQSSGTWSLNSAGTELTFVDASGNVGTQTIISNGNSNSLVLDYSTVFVPANSPGISYSNLSGSATFTK